VLPDDVAAFERHLRDERGVSPHTRAAYLRDVRDFAAFLSREFLNRPEAEIAAEGGDLMEIDLDTGVVRNLTQSTEARAVPLPRIMQRILAEGGLVPFFKKYGSLA